MKEIITFEPPDTLVIYLRVKPPAEDIKDMFVKWAEYIKPEQKCKVMVDASTLEDLLPKTREALRDGGAKFRISRLAVFGASTKMRVMGGLIIKMLPFVDHSTFVKTEEEAREWLAK
ncbi:STAS/SEC14 domain-containing protein [bacterium]|nr:STAS/SEC14 domain-containing protein [bacterium]